MTALLLDGAVTAAQSGDRDAFARLVDAYRGVVASIAVAILRDVEASEDVAQDVFLAAWQGLRTLRNPASFAPWLRQLTRNQAHGALRTRVRRRRRIADADDALLAAAADPSPLARERLMTAEEAVILAEVLDQLPDDAREIVTLYYREGRSARQVADLLGIREDAVKKRLERARGVLRAEMLERFGELAQRTAPTAVFTAAVVASLGIASPAAAATAAVPGALAKGGGAGLASVGLGVVAGIAGVVLTLRGHARQARDDQERRALRRLGLAACALVVVLCAAIQISAMVRSPTALLASWLVVAAIQCHLFLIRLPRVTARRRRAELAEDPGAGRRHRRDQRWIAAVVGLGVAGGTATVMFTAWLLWRAAP